MSDPFIAEIVMFAGTFAPRGWAFCEGQLLPIAQNQALFSLLGTTFGGDGRTTFALPDLRGRVPIHQGSAPGVQPVTLGQKGGSSNHSLTVNEMPSHTHTATAQLRCSTSEAAEASPLNNYLAMPTEDVLAYDTSSDENMSPGALSVTIANAGGNQPLSLMQPYLGLNFIIALVGVFPSRN